MKKNTNTAIIRKLQLLACASIAALLAGCASTGYQQADKTGAGIAEFRNEVTYIAKTCAYLRFQRDNPNAPDCHAYTYADDNWRDYVDVALDFMTILQAA